MVFNFSVSGIPSVYNLTDPYSMSSFVGKMDPLQWTPHMSDCLEALERDKLCPSDELLVAFVRYQLVADEAQKLLVRDVMGESSSAPTYVFRRSLLAKLQAVRDGLPANMPITRKSDMHSWRKAY